MTEREMLDLLPLAAFYAETHYRFRLFPFSLYYRRRPEVIFDAPRRVEPGRPLPVTLLVKDADGFPIEILKVSVKAAAGETVVAEERPINTRISEPLWHRIFDLDLSPLPDGDVQVTAEALVRCRRREFVVRQDNHPGLSRAPFQVYKAADPLPGIPGWHAGELHCHSEFGGDQVEFGAPLEAYIAAAAAMGLDWIALTDHSYNLDDREDDYLRDDPGLTKWRRLQERVEQLNRGRHGVVLIPGEELTCRSATGRNVHLLILGERRFLPGTGDGAQRWLRTRSELSVEEALDRLSPHAVALAAHPFDRVPPLERLLVRRSIWELTDLEWPRLDGWQILNDTPAEGFRRGLEAWKTLLLNGEKRYIHAGNDAHGSFNRFRQIKMPMIRLWENHSHLFGRVTTRVRADEPLTINSLLAALKSGRTAVSDGPAIELTFDRDGRVFHCGDTVHPGADGTLRVRYATSPEFGAVSGIRVMTAANGGERPLLDCCKGDGRLRQSDRGSVEIPLEGGRLFIRAEMETVTNHEQRHMALSNPIWLSR